MLCKKSDLLFTKYDLKVEENNWRKERSFKILNCIIRKILSYTV